MPAPTTTTKASQTLDLGDAEKIIAQYDSALAALIQRIQEAEQLGRNLRQNIAECQTRQQNSLGRYEQRIAEGRRQDADAELDRVGAAQQERQKLTTELGKITARADEFRDDLNRIGKEICESLPPSRISALRERAEAVFISNSRLHAQRALIGSQIERFSREA